MFLVSSIREKLHLNCCCSFNSPVQLSPHPSPLQTGWELDLGRSQRWLNAPPLWILSVSILSGLGQNIMQYRGTKSKGFMGKDNQLHFQIWFVDTQTYKITKMSTKQKWCFLFFVKLVKGAFDWLYSGIGMKRIKTLSNLIGHNSCQVRGKTQPSYISRPSHYF